MQVVAFRKALEAMIDAIPTEAGRSGVAAQATSKASFNVSSDPTAATFRSSEEINTEPTSYSTHVSNWSGSSTSSMLIDGVYDGSEGNEPWLFLVSPTLNGTVGQDQIRVFVLDGPQIQDVINIAADDVPGTVYTLSTGLEVSFSAGDLTATDTTGMWVFSTIGTTVKPANPFNGSGLTDPDLEHGTVVTNGSFDINDVSISVLANDSISSLITKINASAAGVTATYNPMFNERLVLTQNTPGPDADITVGNDTSGVLAALKLDDGLYVPGATGEQNAPMATVPGLSILGTGSFLVNGVPISYDAAVDSLIDVVARIGSSGTGAIGSVWFDEDNKALNSIESTTRGGDLILGGQLGPVGGGIPFFAVTKLEAGIYRPLPGQRRLTAGQARDVAHSFTELLPDFNGLYDDPFKSKQAVFTVRNLRDLVNDEIAEVFDSGKSIIAPRLASRSISMARAARSNSTSARSPRWQSDCVKTAKRPSCFLPATKRKTA